MFECQIMVWLFQCRIISMQNCFSEKFFQCRIVLMQICLNAEWYWFIILMRYCFNANHSSLILALPPIQTHAVVSFQISVFLVNGAWSGYCDLDKRIKSHLHIRVCDNPFFWCYFRFHFCIFGKQSMIWVWLPWWAH